MVRARNEYSNFRVVADTKDGAKNKHDPELTPFGWFPQSLVISDSIDYIAIALMHV